MRPKKLILPLIPMIFFLISCSTAPIVKEPQRLREGFNIKTIALIPLHFETEYLEESQEAEEETEPMRPRPQKDAFLTRLLYREMVLNLDVNVIPVEETSSEFNTIVSESPGIGFREVAIKVGEKLGAQAVLVGSLDKYQEREGGEYGVFSPASVAFYVELLSVPEGVLLWQSYYAETQRPLLEDVTSIGKFFKRGGRWLTADELAREGVQDVVSKLKIFLGKG